MGGKDAPGNLCGDKAIKDVGRPRCASKKINLLKLIRGSLQGESLPFDPEGPKGRMNPNP